MNSDAAKATFGKLVAFVYKLRYLRCSKTSSLVAKHEQHRVDGVAFSTTIRPDYARKALESGEVTIKHNWRLCSVPDERGQWLPVRHTI